MSESRKVTTVVASAAQYAALRAVNLELLSLYWDLRRLIDQRQQG